MSTDLKELLREHYPFWTQLDEKEQREFLKYTAIQTYKKGGALQSRFQYCLGIFVVLSGQVRVYIQSEEGREITLFRTNPGEVCTLSAGCVMEEISFEIMMEATEDAVLMTTGSPSLRKIMEHNLYLDNYIYKCVAEHFSDAMWAISQILFKSFDKRLAGYLEDEKIGRKSTAIQVTHDEIARELGSAREVVSRMLKYFEREGIVTLSRGTIQITDEVRLRTLALLT